MKLVSETRNFESEPSLHRALPLSNTMIRGWSPPGEMVFTLVDLSHEKANVKQLTNSLYCSPPDSSENAPAQGQEGSHAQVLLREPRDFNHGKGSPLVLKLPTTLLAKGFLEPAAGLGWSVQVKLNYTEHPQVVEALEEIRRLATRSFLRECPNDCRPECRSFFYESHVGPINKHHTAFVNVDPQAFGGKERQKEFRNKRVKIAPLLLIDQIYIGKKTGSLLLLTKLIGGDVTEMTELPEHLRIDFDTSPSSSSSSSSSSSPSSSYPVSLSPKLLSLAPVLNGLHKRGRETEKQTCRDMANVLIDVCPSLTKLLTFGLVSEDNDFLPPVTDKASPSGSSDKEHHWDVCSSNPPEIPPVEEHVWDVCSSKPDETQPVDDHVWDVCPSAGSQKASNNEQRWEKRLRSPSPVATSTTTTTSTSMSATRPTPKRKRG